MTTQDAEHPPPSTKPATQRVVEVPATGEIAGTEDAATTVTEDTSVVYVTRAAADTDFAYVFSSWIKAAKEFGCLDGRHRLLSSTIPANLLSDSLHRMIARILTRVASGQARVTVIAATLAPDVILGYAVSEGPVLHWVYVRHKLRGRGVAKRLMQALPVPAAEITQYTQRTTYAGRVTRYLKGAAFNPYAAG